MPFWVLCIMRVNASGERYLISAMKAIPRWVSSLGILRKKLVARMPALRVM